MKYPHTPHLPISPGVSKDDIKHTQDLLIGKYVIVTEKLDGENTSLLSNKFHARSEDSISYPHQSIARQIHGQIKHQIPDYIQLIAENVYAKHSIYYDELTAYLYGLAAIDHNSQQFLSVTDTRTWFETLGIHFAPILFEGIWTGAFQLPARSAFGSAIEGYVVRSIEAFAIEDFDKNVAKWVRKGHVQTDRHWRETWVPNQLRKDSNG